MATANGDNSGPTDIPIPEYDAQILKFYQIAHSLEP